MGIGTLSVETSFVELWATLTAPADHPREPVKHLSVRGPHQVCTRPGGLPEDGFELGEIFETPLAVIATVATGSNAAERQVGLRNVQDAIIDRYATCNGLMKNAPLFLGILPKPIEREGPIMMTDEFECRLELLVEEDG